MQKRVRKGQQGGGQFAPDANRRDEPNFDGPASMDRERVEATHELVGERNLAAMTSRRPDLDPQHRLVIPLDNCGAPWETVRIAWHPWLENYTVERVDYSRSQHGRVLSKIHTEGEFDLRPKVLAQASIVNHEEERTASQPDRRQEPSPELEWSW